MKFRRPWLVAVVIAVLPLVALTVYLVVARLPARREAIAPPPEAPADLEKLRIVFAAGADALQRGDTAATIKLLSSFNFGSREVEEYRLYYLAKGYQLAGNRKSARVTFAALWQRTPRLVYWEEAGLNLGGMYHSIADWEHAGDVYREMIRRSEQSAVTATARWQLINSRIADGDVGAIFHAARDMVIKNPRAPQTSDAIAIVRSLNGQGTNEALKLTAAERLERAVSFMRDGDPQNALDELKVLEAGGVPAELRLPLQLNRGLALNHLRRFEESNRALEPLAAGPFKIAIPAIYHASKNYRVLAASINPMVNKTIIVRQRVGTTRVHAKAKKKPVLKPKYANVKKIVQVVDRAKKAKKETYARLATERMKDLLALPLADEVRIEVLNTLIVTAEAANKDDDERTLITELAKLDPSQEAGLQHFWGKAWADYTSGNLNGATELLLFIRDTYRNPNVKRQAEYWRARAIERLGKKEEAEAIYRSLAAAPYADLYVVYAHARGAPHQDPPINPLKVNRPDWQEIAEESMPRELRLAYELTALSDFRAARLEIQKNLKRANQSYADALLADLYNSSGNSLLVMRSLRRAYPQIATVEQDSVPAYFLRMYYPLKYQGEIVKYSRQNRLDPYLVMGLIHQESLFNPKARSPVGATGLMQLMPPTAKQLARRLRSSSDIENPEVNIRLGTFHFRQLIDLFGGAVHLAVASYNAGQGNVMRWRRAAPKKPLDEFIESIPFPETRNYVKRVTMLAASYRRIAL
jgi:soluble lytic murein transglycosylase-like protein